MKNPSVSIIIPVFNRSDLTVQCLQALFRVTRQIPYEVLVVDNASTDATPQRLKEFAGGVRVLRNETNAGFARACNQGAAAAASDLLLFLNNDTVPQEGWLEPLLDEMRRNPDVAVVGSKLLFPDRRVQHAGVAFTRDTRSPFHPHFLLHMDDPRVNQRRELQAVTAACTLIRAEWFKRCGGFCEEYRNGYEDLDLCLQIRRRGGRIVYQPKSVLFHLESQTPGRKLHDNENRALFFQRCADAILSDEDAFYFADGYRLLERFGDLPTECRLARLESEEERRHWAVVAQCQQAAAEGRRDDVARLLADTEAWPRDAAVRRWAAALCRRSKLPDAARAHCEAALTLDQDAEARFHVAQAVSNPSDSHSTLNARGPRAVPGSQRPLRQTDDLVTCALPTDSNALRAGDGSRSGETPPAPWAASLDTAFGRLRSGDFASARTAFETALLDGAPPRLALPGWWQATRKTGAQAEADSLAQALQTLPRLDSATTAKLAEPHSVDTASSLALDSATAPKLGGPAPSEPASSPQPAAAQPLHAAANLSAAAAAKLTSVIILVHNQLEHTRKCLASLAACTKLPHEIIVVDNASTDGTREFLQQWQQEAPDRLIIRNHRNLGFAAGNNQGLSVARGDYVVLLNNDTVVTESWLEGLLDILARHPRAGVVGPMSNYVSGPQLVKAPGYSDLSQLPVYAARFAQEHRGRSLSVARAVGFCLLVRREVIERLGGLDERFGSGNFEDDDFCIRSRLAGFDVRVAQGVFIHHTGSQTFKGARIDYREAMLRNWSLFKTKWQMPAGQPLEQGYRLPAALPEGATLEVALPDLAQSHQIEPSGDLWEECANDKPAPSCLSVPSSEPASKAHSAVAAASSVARSLPACAQIGDLSAARDLLARNELHEASEITLAALHVRPFHPEAWLLLADIAQAAGDSSCAQACAQQATTLAPGVRTKNAEGRRQNAEAGKQKPGVRNQKSEARSQETEGAPDHAPRITHHASRFTPHASPFTHHASRLSVCLITKNEEAFLDQCLASVRGLAHQLVVVDTGSTDRTIEIAKAHGAEVYSFQWCDDFSAARNAALEHATGDWVLSLDADEELSSEGREKLKRLLSNKSVMAWRLPIIDVGRENEGCCYVPRLFRNAPGLYYVGRVHEQAFTSLEPLRQQWGLENCLGDAALVHYGYRQDVLKDRNKIQRNRQLLERAIQESPDDPNLLMNYGLELVRSGERDSGVSYYRRAFQRVSAQPPAAVTPELREMLLTQMTTQLMVAGNFEELVQILSSPVAASGDLTASLHFALGLADYQTKDFAGGAEQMRHCLNKRSQPALAPINPEILKAGPRHCLALCLDQLGQADAATAEFAKALQDDPKSRAVRFDYARFLAAHGQAVEALNLFFELATERPEDLKVWIEGGRLALSRPDFLEVALDWTTTAYSHFAQHPAVAQQRAEVLTLSGQCETALPLWRQLQSEQADGGGARTFLSAATGGNQQGQDCVQAPQSSDVAADGNVRAPALAALVICETVCGDAQFSPPPRIEPLISREFISWYQRLLQFNARPTVETLNRQIEVLRSSLPSAARLLEAAFADAARGEAMPA